MEDTPPHTAIPPVLESLIEDKKRQLKNARDYNWLTATGKAAGGGALGMAAGLAAWTGAGVKVVMEAVNASHGSFRKFAEKFERLSPEGQQKLTEELSEDLTRRIQHAPGISGAIFLNPGTFIAVTSLLGAGGMLMWHNYGKNKEREQIGGELEKLEKVSASWQERTAQPKDEEKAPRAPK